MKLLKRGVYSLGIEGRLQRYEHVFSLAPAETINGLFRDGCLPRGSDKSTESTTGLHCFRKWSIAMIWRAFSFLKSVRRFPDELLMFADKLSMAHSLEVRVPYLDRTVVEFAQRLIASMKIRNHRGKWIHRQVCQHYLPQQILRRKKRGFAVNVVDGWFNSDFARRVAGNASEQGLSHV